MQGKLITLEGGDGAGKSTLMKNLHAALLQRGIRVKQTKALEGASLAPSIRSILLHQKTPLNDQSELFLFLADRAQHVQEVIVPALEEGFVVLCDRFNDSTVAYQGVARGLDPDWVRSLCLFATKGKEPDLTFYLDLDPKVGLQRILHRSGSKDRIESEDLSFHLHIRKAFLLMAEQEPKRVKVLDASSSEDQVCLQAMEFIDALFFSCRQ
jgi:dTMP kinase